MQCGVKMKAPVKTVTAQSHTETAWLPLMIGVGLTIVLTLYPFILAKRSGDAGHAAAMLAFWSMSAGYIRGVGFIPSHRIWRVLFSSGACWLGLAAATMMIVIQHVH